MKKLSAILTLVMALVILTLSTACSKDAYAGAYVNNGADKTIFDVTADGTDYVKVGKPSEEQNTFAQNIIKRVLGTTSVDTAGTSKEFTLSVNAGKGVYPDNDLLSYTVVSAKNRNSEYDKNVDGSVKFFELYTVSITAEIPAADYYYNVDVYNVVNADAKRGYTEGFALVGTEIGADKVSKTVTATEEMQYDWFAQLNNYTATVFGTDVSSLIEYDVINSIIATLTYDVYTANGKTAIVYTVDPLELTNYGFTSYVITVVTDKYNEIDAVLFNVEGAGDFTFTASFQYCNNVVAPVNALTK